MAKSRSEKHLADKSPRHDSALRIGDIHPGMHIVRYTPYGTVEYRILSWPYVARLPHHDNRPLIVVKLLQIGPAATIRSIPLDMLGIIPYSQNRGWDDVNFCVDVSRRHLLPPPRTPLTYESTFTWPGGGSRGILATW